MRRRTSDRTNLAREQRIRERVCTQMIRDRARARMDTLAMSERELAERIGETYDFVLRFLNGEEELSGGQLYAMAMALNVRPGYFYNEPGNEGVAVVEADLCYLPVLWSETAAG